jgi:protein subunit release factor A
MALNSSIFIILSPYSSTFIYEYSAKLYELELEKQSAEIYAQRKSQVGSGSRSEKIRTYNWKDSRCTDHRINQNFPLQVTSRSSFFIP